MVSTRNMKFSIFAVVALLLTGSFSLVNCGGGGGGSAAAPSGNVPRFAYVANYGENTVSLYVVNAVTGQLRHNGYVFAGISPAAISIDPTGKFAYVANNGGGVSAYTINASTGALTQIDAVPGLLGIQNFPAGTNPRAVSVDPSGKFAYVANYGSNNVSAYSINAGTGALTSIGTTTAVVGITNPISVIIDPTGKFVYVANNGSNNVSAFSIGTTGALTAVAGSPFAAGSAPVSITNDPSGRFVYGANFGGGVSAFRIGATGVLTSAGTATAGTGPSSVSVDPSGRYVYVANTTSGNVTAFTIDAATGALTALVDVDAGYSGNQPTIAAGSNPEFVTVDPSGKFVYVSNYTSNTVSAYRIDAATGALTALPAVAGRYGTYAMAMSTGAAAVTYTPKFAYAANEDSNNISAYRIDAGTGALTSVGTTTAVAGRTAPRSVTVDPFGKFAYAANSGSDNVSIFSINAATGVLTHIDTIVTGNFPASVSIDPSGRFAYVGFSSVILGDPGAVAAYTINAGTGLLTEVAGSPFAAEGQPMSVTVDPTGKFLYVANRIGVLAFSINAVTGALTPIDGNSMALGIQSFAAGDDPWSVTVGPTGKFAYATNFGSRDVSCFSINAATGALTALLGSPQVAGNGPSSFAVNPSGEFAYVTNFQSTSVWVYSIYPAYPSSGRLTLIDIVPGDFSMYLPWSITIDPSGKYAYVAVSAGVLAYSLDETTGAMTTIGTVAAGTGPAFITTTGTIQ